MRPTRETIDDFVGNMLTTKQQYDQLGSSLTKKGNYSFAEWKNFVKKQVFY